MSSSFGNRIKFTLFGESHGKCVGITVDGLPAGIPLDFEYINAFLQRRKPSSAAYSTKRTEADVPEFISGVFNGRTNGAPLTALINNNDCESGDYERIKSTPRPSHADYSAYVKFGGYNDYRGGGHLSARLTAPLCVAGAICKKILLERGITVEAQIISVAGKETDFEETVNDARMRGDTVSGKIKCVVSGVNAGLGSPVFDGIESRIAVPIFGIPAIKGIEFGTVMPYGSQNNDEFIFEDTVKTRTNNHGGILGGITSGMPIFFTVTLKPAPSLAMTQNTIDIKDNKTVQIDIRGRHDCCIAYRAVPVVEAAAACVMTDIIMEENK